MGESNGIQRVGTLVVWSGEISFENFAKFRIEVEAACKEARSGEKPSMEIRIEVHSGGGSSMTGLAAHDLLKTIEDSGTKVVTVACGIVMSSAISVLLGGSQRLAQKNAILMIHSNSKYIGSSLNELGFEREHENMTFLNKVYKKIIKETCGNNLSNKQLAELFAKEKYFSSQQAKTLGFIHEII